MKIKADLHTHTLASGHAYSTIEELARAASQKGIKLIAVTDHGPLMPGGPHQFYFANLNILPEEISGVRVLSGIEANIQNDGSLDLAPDILNRLDFVAAGIHGDGGYQGNSIKENTRATINAIKNPLVRMITHPANNYYPVDIEAVVRAARDYQVILEVNAGSFRGKRGNKELTIRLCRLARKYGTALSLNSDAHFSTEIGNIETLHEIIERADLTENEIINSSTARVLEFIY